MKKLNLKLFEDTCEGGDLLEIENQITKSRCSRKKIASAMLEAMDLGYLEPRHGYEAPVACNHSWKPYMGFTENYNYCEHCGVKEHEN